MARSTCARCGTSRPPDARFCPNCGTPFPWTSADPPMGPRYWGWRFQVDPQEPPPRRDPRYVLIVLGAAMLILGVLLLAVAALVGSAVGAAGGTPNPGPWFTLAGVPFAVLGAALLVLGVAWGLR